MTNGIAVKYKDGSFDLWLNRTCTSGYLPLDGALLRIFRYGTDPIYWEEYSPQFKIAVPEQLVWWEDE